MLLWMLFLLSPSSSSPSSPTSVLFVYGFLGPFWEQYVSTRSSRYFTYEGFLPPLIEYDHQQPQQQQHNEVGEQRFSSTNSRSCWNDTITTTVRWNYDNYNNNNNNDGNDAVVEEDYIISRSVGSAATGSGAAARGDDAKVETDQEQHQRNKPPSMSSIALSQSSSLLLSSISSSLSSLSSISSSKSSVLRGTLLQNYNNNNNNMMYDTSSHTGHDDDDEHHNYTNNNNYGHDNDNGSGIIPVTYTNNPAVVDEWLCSNLPYDGSIIGFDVERVPRMRKSNQRGKIPFSNGATVQLATPTSCLVVQLASRSGVHSNACASILKCVLEDETYVKAGCALDDDLIGLHELWGTLNAKSRFDLGTVVPASIVRGKRGGHNRSGLQYLSRSLLGVNLPKDKRDTHTTWSTVPLSDERIVYAARDAWAGAAIANTLATYDPECFGREALVDLFQQTETPISNLVQRLRRRRKAKAELDSLLFPYQQQQQQQQQQHRNQELEEDDNDDDDVGYCHNIRLPKDVALQAMELRRVINSRVIDHHVIFETTHLESGVPPNYKP